MKKEFYFWFYAKTKEKRIASNSKTKKIAHLGDPEPKKIVYPLNLSSLILWDKLFFEVTAHNHPAHNESTYTLPVIFPRIAICGTPIIDDALL